MWNKIIPQDALFPRKINFKIYHTRVLNELFNRARSDSISLKTKPYTKILFYIFLLFFHKESVTIPSYMLFGYTLYVSV